MAIPEEDIRAMAWGYKALYREAAAALLHIVNECDTKDGCITVAQEALDTMGEPD